MKISYAELLQMMDLKDTSSQEVTEDDLVSLLSPAIDGSSWARVDNSGPDWDDPAYGGAETFEGHMARILLAGKPVTIEDIEGVEGPWELSLAKFDEGVAKFCLSCPNLLAESISEGCMDSCAADALLQCILMGEVVFG